MIVCSIIDFWGWSGSNILKQENQVENDKKKISTKLSAYSLSWQPVRQIYAMQYSCLDSQSVIKPNK